MKIDCFSHICPQKFINAFNGRGVSWEQADRNAQKVGGPTLWDINKRLEVMDSLGDYAQVLVPVAEVVEPIFSPKDTAFLTRIFNDAVAEMANKHPQKFVAAVATIPLNNIDAALKEIDRSINDLGFKGILLHTPVYVYEEGRPLEMGLNYDTMKPLDSPEFMPIYESMSKHDLPIWIHPFGMGGVPVYRGERRGKYMLHLSIGWPLESAIVMSRLVCSGILAKYPNLKFIIHHCGSGIIPVLGGRLDNEFEHFLKAGVIKWDQPGQENPFKNKRAVDYYKMFYGDTALDGSVTGLECGHDFFGSEHILFGTDFPFDLVNGVKLVNQAIDAVNKMRISEADKQLIFEGNIKRILRLDIR